MRRVGRTRLILVPVRLRVFCCDYCWHIDCRDIPARLVFYTSRNGARISRLHRRTRRRASRVIRQCARRARNRCHVSPASHAPVNFDGWRGAFAAVVVIPRHSRRRLARCGGGGGAALGAGYLGSRWAGANRPDFGRPGRPDLGRPGRPGVGWSGGGWGDNWGNRGWGGAGWAAADLAVGAAAQAPYYCGYSNSYYNGYCNYSWYYPSYGPSSKIQVRGGLPWIAAKPALTKELRCSAPTNSAVTKSISQQ
jgi:hypothetical protein